MVIFDDDDEIFFLNRNVLLEAAEVDTWLLPLATNWSNLCLQSRII